MNPADELLRYRVLDPDTLAFILPATDLILLCCVMLCVGLVLGIGVSHFFRDDKEVQHGN